MVRFGSEKQKSGFSYKTLFWPILFIAVLLIFFYGVQHFAISNIEEQQESIENAINRIVVECYALEGSYPPSLTYMKEHYGLTYDEETFFVDYQAIGSNIPPDVTILARP